jgi:thiol-disulfide isomerase/thioredoxin
MFLEPFFVTNQNYQRNSFMKISSTFFVKAMKSLSTVFIIICATLVILQNINAFDFSANAQPNMKNEKFFSYQAPEIVGIQQWFNGEALQISNLKGKVVLVDFWTYSCINCLRTLPHMNKLYEKYHDKGLVIIGVHSPEFFFEKNPKNVAKALTKYGIKYSVALDNDMKTWNNYNNRYWPAHYLINQEGKVVYTHFGEGAYDVMDNNVKSLLGIDSGDKEAKAKDQTKISKEQTPETYLGSERGSRNFNDSDRNFIFPKDLPKHTWALQGDWKVDSQFVESRNAGDSLKFNFLAKKVFLVMASENGEEINVKVLVNGKQKDLGGDVKNGVVKVKNSELYEIVNLSKGEGGVVEIESDSAGLQAYAFTFGD